jgi:hypothetical protein
MAPISTSQFPWTKLVIRYEMYYSGAWNNVSAYVRQDQPGVFSEITHGRQEEATRPDPAKCKFILNNANGRFSPRNPRSPLYGLIGRNTQFRVAIVWNGFTYYRFWGEISQWPLEWTPGGHDNWVTVEASGITRRINRRGQPVTSPIRRLMDSQTTSNVVAYWPLEDISTSESFSSAVTNGLSMTKKNTLGASALGSNSDIPGAAPLPSIDTGWWAGQVRPYTATTELQVTFVVSASAVPSGDGLCVSWSSTGSVGGWSVVYRADGILELRAWATAKANRVLTVPLDGVIGDDGATGIVNNPVRVSVELTQNGANIDYAVWVYSLYGNDGAHGYTGTLAASTFGRVRDVSLNDPGAPNGSLAVGHVLVSKDIITVFPNFYNADIAYSGEYPEVRTRRVCDENGIPWFQVYAQTGTVATQMGPQPIASISEILGECMDLGYLVFDNRSDFGLMLQPMEWRQDRNTALLVDYGKIVAGGMMPVDDDQGVFNDVTVNRSAGGAGVHIVESGALSIQDPPNGVGPYPASATLNLYTEDYAQYWAQWLAHFGTYDESRYPVVAFDLLKDADQTLIAQMLKELENTFNTGMEVGQILRVTNPPDWLAGGPVELVINGWTERIGPYTWEITFNCSPAGPWRTWIVEDPATSNQDDDVSRGHIDTAGSETVGAFVAGTSTTMTVKTNSGPRWVQTSEQAAAFPQDILVSGCRLRVTGIVGTSTAGQTFTVSTTVVNGVTKTIPSGSAVNIWPVYVGV